MKPRSQKKMAWLAFAALVLISGSCLEKKEAATGTQETMPAKTEEKVSQAGNEKGRAGAEKPSQASPEAGSPGGNPERVKKGKALFQGTCSGCHAPDAKGIRGLGSDLTASEFVKSRSDDELLEFLKVGRRARDPANKSGVEMPARGGNPALTDENLRDIIAFLRSIARK
jgi:mono/diheme cytochrome c family protein